MDTANTGLEAIDRSLEALSDEELDALIERARQRASDLSEDEVAAIIAEAVRAPGASPPASTRRGAPINSSC